MSDWPAGAITEQNQHENENEVYGWHCPCCVTSTLFGAEKLINLSAKVWCGSNTYEFSKHEKNENHEKNEKHEKNQKKESGGVYRRGVIDAYDEASGELRCPLFSLLSSLKDSFPHDLVCD